MVNPSAKRQAILAACLSASLLISRTPADAFTLTSSSTLSASKITPTAVSLPASASPLFNSVDVQPPTSNFASSKPISCSAPETDLKLPALAAVSAVVVGDQFIMAACGAAILFAVAVVVDEWLKRKGKEFRISQPQVVGFGNAKTVHVNGAHDQKVLAGDESKHLFGDHNEETVSLAQEQEELIEVNFIDYLSEKLWERHASRNSLRKASVMSHKLYQVSSTYQLASMSSQEFRQVKNFVMRKAMERIKNHHARREQHFSQLQQQQQAKSNQVNMVKELKKEQEKKQLSEQQRALEERIRDVNARAEEAKLNLSSTVDVNVDVLDTESMVEHMEAEPLLVESNGVKTPLVEHNDVQHSEIESPLAVEIKGTEAPALKDNGVESSHNGIEAPVVNGIESPVLKANGVKVPVVEHNGRNGAESSVVKSNGAEPPVMKHNGSNGVAQPKGTKSSSVEVNENSAKIEDSVFSYIGSISGQTFNNHHEDIDFAI